MKKQVVLFFALVPFLFSLLIECTFNQRAYFFSRNNETSIALSYENIDRNGPVLSVKNTAEEAKITLTLEAPAYIQYLGFSPEYVDSEPNEGLQYKIFKNGDTGAGKDIYTRSPGFGDTPRRFLGAKRTVPIRDKVSKLTFIITDNTNVDDFRFSFGDFKTQSIFRFNAPRFIMLLTLSYFGLLMFLQFTGRVQAKREAIAFFTILCMGGCYAYFTPQHCTYDEFAHLIRSYNTADGNFIYYWDEPRLYPDDLVKLNINGDLEYQSYEDYQRTLAGFSGKKANNRTEQILNSSGAVYTFIPYIPSAIGVKLAMLSNGSILTMLRLARLMNVLFYAVIAFLAIRLIPIRKDFLYLFVLLPINVFISANLSVDVFINSLTFLGVALIIKTKYEAKPMKLFHYFLLLCIFGLLPFAKTPYAMLVLLLLMLDKAVLPKEISNVMNRIISIGSAVGTFAVTYLYGNQFELNVWGIPNVDPSKQLSLIFQKPIEYVVNTVRFMSEFFFSRFINNTFGAFAYVLSQMDEFWTLLMVVSLVVLAMNTPLLTRKGEPLFGTTDNVYCLVSLGTSFGLAYTALYMTFTEVGSKYANGFQGRYLLPLVFIFLFMISFRKIKLELKEKNILLYSNILILATNAIVMGALYHTFYQ